MKVLMALAVLVYCLAHPTALHALVHVAALAAGALAHAGGPGLAALRGSLLLGSHWH